MPKTKHKKHTPYVSEAQTTAGNIALAAKKGKLAEIAEYLAPLIYEYWGKVYAANSFYQRTYRNRKKTIKDIRKNILNNYTQFHQALRANKIFEWGSTVLLCLVKSNVPPEYWDYVEFRSFEDDRDNVVYWYITVEMIKNKKRGTFAVYNEQGERKEEPEKYLEFSDKLKLRSVMI